MIISLELSDNVIKTFCEQNGVDVDECIEVIKNFYKKESDDGLFEEKLELEIMNY